MDVRKGEDMKRQELYMIALPAELFICNSSLVGLKG
jgi:hypothetical protein